MNHSNFFEEGTHDNKIPGVVVGIVTDNEDPEDVGRVKLKFPWRDADDETYWARIATEMTGDGYGTYFLPEVGDEVLVAFENGDIHQPFVLGSLWTGKKKPQRKNGDGDNDVREIKSRSGHVLRFDDDEDPEGLVRIETKRGHVITLDDGKDTERIRVEDTDGQYIEFTDGHITVSGNEEVAIEAQSISLTADKEVTVDSKGTVGVSGNSKVDVNSKGQLTVSSNGIMGINASGPLSIKGSIIQLN